MFAIALAAGVGNLLAADTIYTLKLKRRGVDFARARPDRLLEGLTVREAMRPLPEAGAPAPHLPVLGPEQTLQRRSRRSC